MLLPALTIARVTFLESVRQPIYLILILGCALLMVLTTASTGYSLGYTDTAEVFGDDKLLLDLGMATVLFCGTLLAGFIATHAVGREIENKTVLTVVSKPVPRTAVVLGKYLGGSAAVLIAVITMIAFLLMAIRHGVMTTVSDPLDAPIITFGVAGLFIALFIGTWGNFFYGWHFCQTATILLCPLMVGAFILALNFTQEGWKVQPITTDFKPQIFTASLALIAAQLVLTAIAIAASTRLSQVMTIVICFAVFTGGLLSNHFVGRRAFENQPLTTITRADPEIERMRPFSATGDTYTIVLKNPPSRTIRPGDALFFGPNPNGLALASGSFPPFAGNFADRDSWFRNIPGAIVVTDVGTLGQQLTIQQLGSSPVRVQRPPAPGDYIFLTPTRVNPIALGLWGIMPNFQFFWLTDAVTQNHPVPPGHMLLIAAYALCQILAFLAIAVALFQRREVG